MGTVFYLINHYQRMHIRSFLSRFIGDRLRTGSESHPRMGFLEVFALPPFGRNDSEEKG
jgi:hypothetical protein